MLGRLLDGRYQIERVLGSGGFGQTYIAQDTKRPGNPQCVLKHLSFSSHDPAILRQVRRMFFSEAESLERLGRHDQIPQLLAYFEENGEFYLVQEFIDGHPLSDEFVAGRKLSEHEVVDLLEDVLHVLEFVHAQGVIHRDLKPENLIRRDRDQKLVLIDFGAVKTIETSIAETATETQMSVPVYTSGYAASEQCLGKPRINSDIYSLGVIAIQALTGTRPSQLMHDPNTCELIWRDQASVSDDLAIVLETMTKFHFSQRYQTAKQALNAIEQIKSPLFTQAPFTKFDGLQLPSEPIHDQPRSPKGFAAKRRLRIAAIGVGTAAILGLSTWALTREKLPAPETSLKTIPTAAQMSFGETLIGSSANTPLKQLAGDQIRRGNYSEAVRLFEQARKVDRRDPETLIYLNNARIGTQKAYTIAVALPLRTQPQSALDVLRGVAQAQDRLNRNQGIDGIKLKVAIASDNSNPELAKQIAQQFVNDPNVLGVVGHGTSDLSLETAKIYEAGELVAIAPLSSAKDLSGLSPYLFRTMPSDELPAKRLAGYMVNQLKKRKVAIFFNSASAYSRSLKEAFKDALYYGDKGTVVGEVDLTNPSFEAADSVEQTIQKGAQVILLATNSEFFDRALLVVNANRRRLPLLAGDSLYGRRVLNEVGSAADGMVIAVPAAQTQLENSSFQQQARSLWGTNVEWRSALGYDAAQTLIAAMQKAPTRNGIRSVLATPSFAAIGALSPVSFSTMGDREMAIALMRVTPTKSGRYVFKPVTK